MGAPKMNKKKAEEKAIDFLKEVEKEENTKNLEGIEKEGSTKNNKIAKEIKNIKKKLDKIEKRQNNFKDRLDGFNKKLDHLNSNNVDLDKNQKKFLKKLGNEFNKLKTEVNDIQETIEQNPRYSKYFDKLGRAKDFDTNDYQGNRVSNAYKIYRHLRKKATKRQKRKTKETKKGIKKKTRSTDCPDPLKITIKYSGSKKARYIAVNRSINKLEELTKEDNLEGDFYTKNKRKKTYLILELPQRAIEEGK